MDTEDLRRQALDIFHAGVRAVEPGKAIRNVVRRDTRLLTVGSQQYDLNDYRHIYVVGGGKAGAAMALEIEALLGDRVTQGRVNVKYDHLAPTRLIQLHEAGHPVPDDGGLAGTQAIMQLLHSATEHDLVICLISGGGSALLPAPAPGITLQQKQDVTALLLRCGATIHEINAVRKHISALKGGQFARLAAPATILTLILSDVIGDPLDTIASGPTVPDSTTFQHCLNIVARYDLDDQVPPAVLHRLQQGQAGEIPETPKPGDPLFEHTYNVIVGSNIVAAEAAARQAETFGYRPLILSTRIEGETRNVARVHTAIAKEILNSGHPIAPPACLITGGETTVTVRGDGLGGRNQEFALAAALELEGLNQVVLLSAGTDGTDGPTDAAGALVDGQTVGRAHAQGLDPHHYLKNNDSYHFFEPLHDLLKTGPTNTNVMDLRIVLIGEHV